MLPDPRHVAKHDPTQAGPELSQREFQIEMPGRGTVAGREWNSGGGAGRVGILHGLGDHAGRYGRVVRALVESNFAVEALDLPGHGRSYGTRGHVDSWEEYAAAVEAWWSRPRESGRPMDALLGHSMGCLVALDFAVRHPDRLRALVLSAPPFEVVLRATMLKVKLAQLIVRVWPAFSQHTPILPSMLSHDPDVVRAHNEDPLVHYLMSARLFFEYTAKNAALREGAARLPVRTLVIHGTEDAISSPTGSKRWVEAAPAGMAELRLYPGLFHEVLNEPQGLAIAGEIAEWLRLSLR